MQTNDIKKGMRVKLRNGWYGTMFDNMKGNARMVRVEGDYTEIGSVYGHDIFAVESDGRWLIVEHTPKQIAMRERIAAGSMF